MTVTQRWGRLEAVVAPSGHAERALRVRRPWTGVGGPGGRGEGAGRGGGPGTGGGGSRGGLRQVGGRSGICISNKQNEKAASRPANVAPSCCLLGGFCSCRCKPANLPVGAGPGTAHLPPGPGLQPLLERDSLQPAEAAPGTLAAQEGLPAPAGHPSHLGRL